MVCAAADSVVDQVTLLPSNNGLRHSEQYLLYVRSLCSLPVLIYSNFFQFFLNLFAFLSEKRGRVKKFDDQFLAKTDKYLPNIYIINLSSAIIPHLVQHTY